MRYRLTRLLGDPSFDQVTERFDRVGLHPIAEVRSSRVTLAAAVLLLSTLLLGLHIQSAKSLQPLAYPAKHVLHGDLRPDSETRRQRQLIKCPTRQIAATIFSLTPPNIGSRTEWPAPNYLDRSSLRLLRSLALFLRPPPSA